jgi:hypothetical protein
MSEGLPEFLVQGELARLIPVCAPNQRERAACSVLLAALRVVHPLAWDLLSEMGKRVGVDPGLYRGRPSESDRGEMQTGRVDNF